MAMQHQSTRRQRYHGRRHDADTRPRPAEAPIEISWKRLPGAPMAHAFSSGPHWSRSACRAERWTVLVEDPEPTDPLCADCIAIVGPPLTESEKRLMDGNR
jgi:hypothetical protein